MGAKIFAIATFLAILAFITFNTLAISNRIDEITQAVEASETYDEVIEAKKLYARHEKFISISVSHEDLMSIEDLFAEYEAEAKYEDDNMEITKNRLISALEHLRRLSSVNINSII